MMEEWRRERSERGGGGVKENTPLNNNLSKQYKNNKLIAFYRLGLLAVSGVPGVSDIRQRFLPFGKKYIL